WLHVDDHCAALWEIACRGRIGESYIIGSGREICNRDLLQLLCSIMDELAPRADAACHQESIVSVTDRPGHDARYAIDATKLRSDLAWQPNIPLEEGLRTTVRWYLDHRAWWQPLWENQVARAL
ncbi:MAG TPA: dTDP-glucose 4,6-dehydratase, partial [Verrucomicrobiales bacterium]|nr:dTDP-glucose 4,6-dehydratase [Verrucomicrobiales bacterium]